MNRWRSWLRRVWLPHWLRPLSAQTAATAVHPLAVTIVAMGLFGCNAGRALYASPGDYADYRRVRLAESYDDRMAAAWEYLQRRPDGRYSERLQDYFDRAEPVYYRARQRNVAGLQAYLRALPKGPHSVEALRLLGVRQYEQRKQPADATALRITQLRIDARNTSRKAAGAALNWWLIALTQPEVWRQSWSELPQAALIRYRMSQPAPSCEPQPLEPSGQAGQLCTKSMVRRFVVRGPDGPLERKLQLNMQVLLDERYHPRSVTFSGPALLLRSREAQDSRMLAEDAPERQRIAEAFSRQLIEALFANERICNGGSDASGVTVLDCEGVRLTVLPSFDGGVDRVRLSTLDGDEASDSAVTDPADKPDAPAAEELYD